MGHKVNPVGFRIGINRDWNSRWYADGKKYSKFLLEDMAIRNYLKKETANALLSHIEIDRKQNNDDTYKVSVKVFVAKPGVVMGQDSTNINRIVTELKDIVKSGTVNVDVVPVDNPDLDANIVAQQIAIQLENRASFRSAQKMAISKVRKAGAKGCRTLVGGRLGGADIARNEGYKDGIIPLHTLKSDIDFAIAEARTTYGRLGVKVWICRGNYKTKEEIEAEKLQVKTSNEQAPRHPRNNHRPHNNNKDEGGNE